MAKLLRLNTALIIGDRTVSSGDYPLDAIDAALQKRLLVQGLAEVVDVEVNAEAQEPAPSATEIAKRKKPASPPAE